MDQVLMPPGDHCDARGDERHDLEARGGEEAEAPPLKSPSGSRRLPARGLSAPRSPAARRGSCRGDPGAVLHDAGSADERRHHGWRLRELARAPPELTDTSARARCRHRCWGHREARAPPDSEPVSARERPRRRPREGARSAPGCGEKQVSGLDRAPFRRTGRCSYPCTGLCSATLCVSLGALSDARVGRCRLGSPLDRCGPLRLCCWWRRCLAGWRSRAA